MTINEAKRRFPNCSAAFLKANCVDAGAARIPAAHPKPVEGIALERASNGEAKSGPCVKRRAFIRYFVFSKRPADYDNYHIKELQDCLVRAGILDGDEWDVLQGQVVSQKAYTEEQVRTEIQITFYAL